MSDLVLAFALIGTLLMVATLVSGLVERSPLTFPLIFLGLGFVLGELGLGVIKMGPVYVRVYPCGLRWGKPPSRRLVWQNCVQSSGEGRTSPWLTGCSVEF